MIDVFDRTPPHDARAERGLCACAIIKSDVVADASRIVRAEDFHLGSCRAVWAVVSEAYEQGEIVDAILLQSKLKENGTQVDDATLAEIIESEITPFMAGRYAEIVADRAARRRLAAGAMDAAGSAYDESKPLSEALAVLERLSSDEDPPISGAVDSKAGLEATLQEINSATGSAIATGFDCFDTSYGGLFGGELAILAAKTGGGKSAFSMQICESIARSRPVLIASLEMGSNEIHRRRLARHTGIELKKMRNGDLTDDERRILDVAVSDLETSRLHILDAANCGLPEIARESRRLKHREGGLGLIAVDYLQLLRSDADDSKSNRERQVAGLTRGLKCLARDLKVPVLCLCQLNRKADDADEPRPSHLRESGAIEQDADVVMFVHRENYQETEKTKLIVAKHRNGQSQSFPMRWDGPRFQFLESKWGGGQPFEADDFSFPASDNWSGTNFMDATSCE